MHITSLTTPLVYFRQARHSFLAAAVISICASAANAAPTYADWADLALAAPAVVDVDLTKVSRLGKRLAPDVPQGEIRALVEGRLNAALKAPSILPVKAEWLWQGEATDRGRTPFQRADRVLIFAEPAGGSSKADVQQYRLISNQGLQPWSPETDRQVRAILSEAAQAEKRDLMVTGVLDGHTTPGTIAGVRQSQFFLSTVGDKPITLVVERQPDTPARVTAAVGEFISNAAPIRPETLTWYALACGLPEKLPQPLADEAELAEDYATAREEIGVCERTLTAEPK